MEPECEESVQNESPTKTSAPLLAENGHIGDEDVFDETETLKPPEEVTMDSKQDETATGDVSKSETATKDPLDESEEPAAKSGESINGGTMEESLIASTLTEDESKDQMKQPAADSVMNAACESKKTNVEQGEEQHGSEIITSTSEKVAVYNS